MMNANESRRSFLLSAATIGAGLALGRDAAAAEKAVEVEDVLPIEDLMREHGVLRRVLLIYDEAVRRLDGKADLDPEPLRGATRIIRQFIEDYHEKDEEKLIFPRFEKAGKLVDLVKVLREQHRGGRRVTEGISETLKSPLKDAGERRKLRALLADFVRMYRPHAAREDTILFPAFHELVTPREYAALGDEFEAEEHRLFGQDGFEKMVAEVEHLEKTLGLFDLAQFTPRGA
jgi:hemerythrin-like domain-containing protein